MNLFAFFVDLTRKKNSKTWISAEAVFTGKTKPAMVRTRMGYRATNYLSYEIVYIANDKEMHSWYVFYPLDAPNPEELVGQTVLIKYNKHRPYNFVQEIEETE